ncbi:MAG TPA: BTAD domain-containing putative transcriptional regulator, partial [Kribbella sp.]|nr:BTAD domain-containing putative transcriptional regulator [Kribbella sp.]
HDSVLGTAQAMVAEAPLRERRWALLATAQYQAGRQRDALETLRRLRGVLSRELGLDPSPEIEALEQAILRQEPALAGPSALPEPSATCPYQGLKPYDLDDADLFFGRESEVAAGLRKLSDTSILAVVGPSGCGKSSLVRAGVAASLRRDGRRVVTITPGAHPMATLAGALPGRGSLPTLVVDQCEEAFSLCQDVTERTAFLARLTDHAAQAPLVLSFRADRFADLSSHPGFAHVVEKGLHLLTGMSESELRSAITEPARLAALVVEPGLVDLLIGEVAGQPGALPLMSHVLAETWQRREGRTLTVAGYRASGGIQGAVAQSAEQVYAQLTPEQRPMLKALLLRLVTPGPDGQPVRSRLPRRSVVTGPESEQLVDLLISARLVTSDDGVVELAHEALARAWPRLRGWLDDDLEGQQILHHLTQVADSWDSLNRPDSELYRGVRLAKAVQWRDQASPDLTTTEQDFLTASEQLADAELHAAESRARHEARINRRLRTALGTAAFLLVGALIAGFLAAGQARRADRQAVAAEQSATIAAAGRAGAKAVVQTDIDTSLLLAVAGVRMNSSPESRANLLAAMANHPQLIRSYPTEKREVFGLEASPDDRSVVLYDAYGTALRYDLTSGKLGAEHRPPNPSSGAVHMDYVGPIAIAPRGGQLAVGMPPPTTQPVRLLDPVTLRPLALQLPGFSRIPARAIHLAYSRDGSSMAAMIQYYGNGTSNDFSSGAVLVWDVRPGSAPALRRTLPLPPDAVRDAVLSPTGDRLYLSRPAAAYDLRTGRLLYSRPELTFLDIDVSADGKLLALAGEAKDEGGPNVNDVLLVDAATGTVRRRLLVHTDQLWGVRFSHDGKLVASSGSDLRVAVWNVASGRLLEDIPISEGDFQTVAFSPDDKTLYTSGVDAAIRAWDLTGSSRYIEEIVQPTEFVFGCRLMAPGGTTMFRGVDADGRFIDVATGKVVRFPISDAWSNTCGSWHPSGGR